MLCKMCLVTEKMDLIDSDESLPADYEPPKMELVYKGAQSHVVIPDNKNINQIEYTVAKPLSNAPPGSTSVGQTEIAATSISKDKLKVVDAEQMKKQPKLVSGEPVLSNSQKVD